ncbi:hypothetical protein [Hyalangium sp.]|uniref:hypothetical protein n=1 Tax=Hyalangium sp. TaxID=2028555 RepID=UPI002D6AA439|nr:hypothetical protein [Hyalangium sp.]HYH99244.1 hypothetical protein [Hyalangium sp.]
MSRLTRVISSLALAGLLAHCATPSGSGGAVSGDTVALRFAWPLGLTVQVASTSTVTQKDQPPEFSSLTYQLRLEGLGEERKLLTEQMIPTTIGTPLDEGPPPPMPTLVLGPKGELRRTEGIDKVVEEMAQQAEIQGIPKEQQAQITGLVHDALEQAARSRWEVLVGKWSGLALKPGEATERKSQTAVPLFGSVAATRERVLLKERVPCTEGETEKRCVRLVLESSLDPDKLDHATDELLRKLKSVMKANMAVPDEALPELTVMKIRVDSTLEFIAEPETLVPYSQRTVTNSHVIIQEPEGERKNFELQSERLERFTPAAR